VAIHTFWSAFQSAVSLLPQFAKTNSRSNAKETLESAQPSSVSGNSRGIFRHL
jgi:hypothetical protein